MDAIAAVTTTSTTLLSASPLQRFETEPEAINQISRLLEDVKPSISPADIYLLAAELDFVRLSIQLTSWFIHTTLVSISTFLELLQDKKAWILNKGVHLDISYESSKDKLADETICALVELCTGSFEATPKIKDAITEFLAQMSFFDSQNLSTDLIDATRRTLQPSWEFVLETETTDGSPDYDILSTLQDMALLTRQTSSSDALAINPTVSCWLNRRQGLEAAVTLTTQACDVLQAAIASADTCTMLATPRNFWLSHVRVCCQNQKRYFVAAQFEKAQVSNHLYHFGALLQDSRLAGDAMEPLALARSGLMRRNAFDTIEGLSVQSRLNRVLLELNVQPTQIDIRRAESVLEADHPMVFEFHREYAILLGKQCKYEESAAYLLHLLEQIVQRLGPGHELASRVKYNLARIYGHIPGHVERQISLAMQSQEEFELLVGEYHVRTLNASAVAAAILYDNGRYPEAEGFHRKAVAISGAILGECHSITAARVLQLADTFRKQAKNEEAEELYKHTLANLERELGPQHVLTLKVRRDLADLYYMIDRDDEAETLHRQVMAGFEKKLGPQHEETLISARFLAWVYHHQHRYTEAQETMSHVISASKATLGLKHRRTLMHIQTAARMYSNQKKYDEAEELYLQALQGFEEISGPSHPNTLEIAMSLGLLYYLQDKNAESEEMYKRAAKGFQEVHGRDHDKTIEALVNLGDSYHNGRDYANAKHIYQLAVDICSASRGQNSQKTFDVLQRLNDSRVSLFGWNWEAFRLLSRRMMEASREVEGPWTRNTLWYITQYWLSSSLIYSKKIWRRWNRK